MKKPSPYQKTKSGPAPRGRARPKPKRDSSEPWMETGGEMPLAKARAEAKKKLTITPKPARKPKVEAAPVEEVAKEVKAPRPPRKRKETGGVLGTDKPERLHKFLASCGLTSRRKAEELMLEGRVEVNGVIVTELGFKVSPADDVKVDGQRVAPERLLYVLMNKPKGYVTTMSDDRRRRTVVDLLPAISSTVKPVGRLDLETEGILLFTNDGELATRLMHPRYGVEKEYMAKVKGLATEAACVKLRKGVYIESGRTSPADVSIAFADATASTLRIVIHEGKKRQVRLMCQAVGLPVIGLRRTRYAFLSSRGMRGGESRMLGKAEIDRLREMVGLKPL